ncbi:MAG TPA: methylated-DNA--[protein]-cysteine S-methyltransferase [Gemmatimonadaceae bacterium]
MTTIVHDTPVGPLTLTSDGRALTGVWFPGKDDAPQATPDEGSDAILDLTRRELDAYFAGRLREFSVPLAPRGTPFQQRVWAALREIPYGSTTTYGAIAAKLGARSAVRAVGAANGANPIPIIVPCHRVIGADGSLTGFGGGLERKRFLLDLERGTASPFPAGAASIIDSPVGLNGVRLDFSTKNRV